MKLAVDRRWIFLLAVLGLSLLILCINLIVNPWWIAVWRFVQAVVVFSIILFAGSKWLFSWILAQPAQGAGKGAAREQAGDTVGQHVDLVADDRREDDGRDEEVKA